VRELSGTGREQFGTEQERFGAVWERFGTVRERFGSVGTVRRNVGSVRHSAGTVWHSAGTVWHSAGTVVCLYVCVRVCVYHSPAVGHETAREAVLLDRALPPLADGGAAHVHHLARLEHLRRQQLLTGSVRRRHAVF